MALQRRVVRLIMVAALGLGMSGIAWANGEEFFHSNGALDLYYFGHIKDRNGKVLDGVTVTVSAKTLGMKIPVRNDSPGHFRTPDVGKAIKGLGKKFDPTQLEITVSKPGYRQVAPSTQRVPAKIKGAVQVEFVMEPTGAPAAK